MLAHLVVIAFSLVIVTFAAGVIWFNYIQHRSVEMDEPAHTPRESKTGLAFEPEAELQQRSTAHPA